MSESGKKRVLFICTHNSARSQMVEAGVDISRHRSKSLAEFTGQTFDAVVTVCATVTATFSQKPRLAQARSWDAQIFESTPAPDASETEVSSQGACA